MTDVTGNLPAFPCEAQGDRSVPPEHDYLQTGVYSSKFPGMTLRDYFAGQALAGLMANANMPFAPDYAECEPRQIAEACRDIADAVVATLARRTPAGDA